MFFKKKKKKTSVFVNTVSKDVEGIRFQIRSPQSVIQSVKVKVLVAESCPPLCNPMDCSLPGFSVHGILQARILEGVAIPFSRGFSQPRD